MPLPHEKVLLAKPWAQAHARPLRPASRAPPRPHVSALPAGGARGRWAPEGRSCDWRSHPLALHETGQWSVKFHSHDLPRVPPRMPEQNSGCPCQRGSRCRADVPEAAGLLAGAAPAGERPLTVLAQLQRPCSGRRAVGPGPALPQRADHRLGRLRRGLRSAGSWDTPVDPVCHLLGPGDTSRPRSGTRAAPRLAVRTAGPGAAAVGAPGTATPVLPLPSPTS